MSARDDLLDRCVEVLLRRGIGDLSLREIAAEARTSHRMLIYHFGSRDGLLVAIVGRVEAEQRITLEALPGDAFEVSRAFWQRLTDPALAPAERLFFEIYVQALHGRNWTASFRAAVIDAFQGPLVVFYERLGATSTARHHARLGLAVTRGLLLDRLLTGDRTATDEAMELFGSMVAQSLASKVDPLARSAKSPRPTDQSGGRRESKSRRPRTGRLRRNDVE